MVTAQNVNIPTNLFNYSLAFCLLVTGKIVAEVGLNEKKNETWCSSSNDCHATWNGFRFVVIKLRQST